MITLAVFILNHYVDNKLSGRRYLLYTCFCVLFESEPPSLRVFVRFQNVSKSTLGPLFTQAFQFVRLCG